MSDTAPIKKRKFEYFLYQERAKQLDRQAGVSAIGEVATFLFTFLAGTLFFPVDKLLLWLLPSIAISILVYFYVKATFTKPNNYWPQRLQRSTHGALAVGLAWGFFPFFFFVENDVFYTILIVGIFTGFVSGGLSSTFAYSPSFYMFAIGAYTPFISRLIMTESSLYRILTGLISFYIITLFALSKNMSKLFMQTAHANYEKAELLDELVYEKKTALRAVESKTKFLASASHDLRQPINAIGLFANSLKSANSEKNRILASDKIEHSVNALNRMLQGFLEVSRLDAGLITNEPIHLRLLPALTQILTEFKDQTSHIKVTVKIPANTAIYIDQDIFRKVISNVIDNARKYTHTGDISIRARHQGNEVRLTIADTGEGIPHSKLNYIFDEFEQQNNPERDQKKGLGLGLSIIRRLCEVADIKLNLTSKLGVGTTVELALKIGEFSLANWQEDNHTSVSWNNIVVLVIENELDTLEGMRLLIEGWGSQCILSESSEQALVHLEAASVAPNIILSDYRLRGDETGIDAIESIRDEYNSKIPAIILTGDTSPNRITELENGGQTVIYKPVDPDKLKLKVANIIAAKSPHQR